MRGLLQMRDSALPFCFGDDEAREEFAHATSHFAAEDQIDSGVVYLRGPTNGPVPTN